MRPLVPLSFLQYFKCNGLTIIQIAHMDVEKSDWMILGIDAIYDIFIKSFCFYRHDEGVFSYVQYSVWKNK